MADSQRMEWLGQDPTALVTQLRKLADDLDIIRNCDRPPPDAVDINDWFVGRRAVSCLVGRPVGHPFIDNGHPMVSSELFFMDVERGYARSFSRWYRLRNCMGDVDAEGRRWPH